jgi:hypothetical protein
MRAKKTLMKLTEGWQQYSTAQHLQLLTEADLAKPALSNQNVNFCHNIEKYAIKQQFNRFCD